MAPRMPPEYLEFRRKQIVQAAWELFAQKGYRETTMRDLAAKLGVSTGVLYTYFKGKGEILEALEARSFGRNSALYDRLSQEKSVRRAIATILGEYAVNWESPEWRVASRANINLTVESLRHEELRSSVASLYRSSTGRLTDLIKRGVEAGEFAEDIDPVVYSHFLSALFLGLQLLLATIEDERLGESVGRMSKILVKNIWSDSEDSQQEK